MDTPSVHIMDSGSTGLSAYKGSMLLVYLLLGWPQGVNQLSNLLARQETWSNSQFHSSQAQDGSELPEQDDSKAATEIKSPVSS